MNWSDNYRGRNRANSRRKISEYNGRLAADPAQVFTVKTKTGERRRIFAHYGDAAGAIAYAQKTYTPPFIVYNTDNLKTATIREVVNP